MCFLFNLKIINLPAKRSSAFAAAAAAAVKQIKRPALFVLPTDTYIYVDEHQHTHIHTYINTYANGCIMCSCCRCNNSLPTICNDLSQRCQSLLSSSFNQYIHTECVSLCVCLSDGHSLHCWLQQLLPQLLLLMLMLA